MDLNKLAIAARPRRAWEAVDLGLQMGRRWWWPMARLWLIFTAPLIVLACLLPPAYSGAVVLIYWWGKILWERPLLHLLSLAIFAECPSLRQSLRAAASLIKQDLLLSLLWHRWSVRRSFIAPVRQLEGLTGVKRRQRIAVLGSADGGTATCVTVMLMHMEAILFAGMLFVIYTLLPDDMALAWTDVLEFLESQSYAVLNALFYWAFTAALAPFYVACGFALYLNRRISLEAWDIDIAFRQLAQRLDQQRNLGAKAASLLPVIGLALMCGWGSLASPAARAYDTQLPNGEATTDAAHLSDKSLVAAQAHPSANDEKAIDPQSARARILAIKSGEAFHHIQHQTQLKWRWPWDDKPKKDKDLLPLWLKKVLRAIPGIAEVVLWLIALTLMFWVAVNYRTWRARFGWMSPRGRLTKNPQQLFGLDIQAATLPDDIQGNAVALVTNEQTRAALALLYRASLSQLVARGLVIPQGFTEGDCLAQVLTPTNPLNLNPITQHYFCALTEAWRQLAYGQQTSPQALVLAQQWNRAWATHPEPSGEH